VAADRRAALAARPPAGRRLRDLLAACRSNAVALSSACLILTTLVTGVLGYAYWIAAARAFAVHDVGLVVTLVSAVVLVADVGNLGFGLGAAYVLPKAADRWGGTVAGFLLAAGGCSAALGALAALAAVLAGAEAAAVERPALVAGLFVLTCAAWAASLVLDQILTIEGAAGLLLLRNALASLGRLLLLPAVVALEPAEAVVALFASWGASTLAAGGLALALLARTGGRRLR
jgi:O-antigen/teichoic acid export membrane protein